MKQMFNFEISGRIKAEDKEEAENLLRDYLNKNTIDSVHMEFLEVE
jgi:hypothetical protein